MVRVIPHRPRKVQPGRRADILVFLMIGTRYFFHLGFIFVSRAGGNVGDIIRVSSSSGRAIVIFADRWAGVSYWICCCLVFGVAGEDFFSCMFFYFVFFALLCLWPGPRKLGRTSCMRFAVRAGVFPDRRVELVRRARLVLRPARGCFWPRRFNVGL